MNGARRKATSAVERAARRGGHERDDSSPYRCPEDTPNGRILRACGTGSLRAALSDAALKELTEVVERLDRRRQITSASRAFRAAIDLWSHGTLFHPDRLDWPTVVDRKDHWVLDLAWAATADFIISLDPDLTEPTMPFPVEVLEPDELLARLVL